MFPELNIYAFAPHIFCIQNWRCNLYYLNLAYLIARSAPFIIQLLPICCRYIYANFTSKVGGAICITMAGLFDCQKVRWVEAICMLFFLSVLGQKFSGPPPKADFDIGESVFFSIQ